jgi:CO/xanthine dehydrogenase Mo-binding subunit/aerobic-type carbon monoxide dehydrogenase small subunit (CoxS/CutS family)
MITLNVNDQFHSIEVDPETPLLYVLRNDLGLKGPKFGCGSEQCNACKVLVDGADVPSCQLPVSHVAGSKIITVEGLGTTGSPHPLQETFVEEQAIQCGYCAAGMIIAAQGLLNRIRYPTDNDIREALTGNICRCGVYERVRRAIKMRVGRPIWEPIYEVIDSDNLNPPPQTEGLAASIQQTPDLDAWIRIEADETVAIFSGKAEIGQGIRTAVAQIAAEELDVSLGRIRVISADTGRTPNEGITAGSMSTQVGGTSVRQAAAEARYVMLSMAFEELEAATPQEELVVDDGTITDPITGRQITYWALMGGRLFGRSITGAGQPKSPSSHRVIGQAVKRLDLMAKVTGLPSYVHDLDLPDMVHGRVVRPPTYGSRLVDLDESKVSAMPGVIKVVLDGSFLGVIGEREDQVLEARETLVEASTWRQDEEAPEVNTDTLKQHLLSQPNQSVLIVDGTATNDPIPSPTTPEDAAQSLEATYFRPYHMHGSLGPSAAVAQMKEGELTIWSHTQGAFFLQASIAQVLGLDRDQVRIVHTEGAGCYGHNGADDAALDAALLARTLPGRPVSVKWMRSDEHTWEPYGAAMAIKMAASLTNEGQIATWNHDVWSYPHTARPRPVGGRKSGFVAAWHLGVPWKKPAPKLIVGTHFGGYRNADPLYALPKKRVVAHFVGIDPVQFRLNHMDDGRARDVIEAAAEKADWEVKTRPTGDGQGRGFAFAQYKNRACYSAVVVDLVVDEESGEITLKKAIIAADAGQIVNPDGLSNQLEGGFFQSASWTLQEQVAFDKDGIKSQDWDTYPVLRFSGAPEIETVLINRPAFPFLGTGEASQGPTAAAIANAVFDATGVRVRDLPITPASLQTWSEARNQHLE